MSKDNLGDRMKTYYEDRTRYYLPRRNYTIIRIDGKAFHTYTRGMGRPFDDTFMYNMDETAKELCSQIMGAKFAYVQSDEISILLTDFDTLQTQAWFDNNLQKMCSVSASIATRAFNGVSLSRKYAEFDSRVFQIPSLSEVLNYYLWRQQDCTRNSIQAVAQSLYSQKQLHGKNTSQLQEMIFQKGTNWNDYKSYYKRGRVVYKEAFDYEGTIRTRWAVDADIPIFSQDWNYLDKWIPMRDDVNIQKILNEQV